MLHLNRLRCLRNLNWKKPFKSNIRQYSIPRVKQPGSEIALNHFDQFYRTVFENWPSIRLGLLCPHSYCAVVNVFSHEKSPTELFPDMEVFNMKDAYYLQLGDLGDINTTTESPLQDSPKDSEMTDSSTLNCNQPSAASSTLNFNQPSAASSEPADYNEFMPATELKHRDLNTEEFSDFYDPNIEYDAQVIKHGVIHYPEHWEMYYCPRGRFKKFPPPKEDISGLLNYYLMDGASLLPVFALDVQKGEEVGDLCASPGGKTLAILFGMRFGKLVCNDASLSRVNKLKTVLSSYLPNTQEWSKKILVSNLDVCDWRCFELFDKILLDVPCTNDRLSVTKDANNIFQQKRFNERMQIPRTQTTMLCAALQALKPGGSLVYSTCSLSPIQNDGVIHMSLAKLSVECPFEFAVQDLTQAFLPFKSMFQYSDTCQYGQLVVPFLPLNYGPMYISKITRTK